MRFDDDVDSRRRAESLKDDVLISVALGLFLGYVAGFDELAHKRLVARDQANLAVANQVCAAVADLSKICRGAVEPDGREGRAHAGIFGMLRALLKYVEVGKLDGQPQPLVKRYPGVGRARLQFEHTVAHALDGEAARHLARERPAHAVGDGEQRAEMALVEGGQVLGRIDRKTFGCPGIGRREVEDKKIILVAGTDHPLIGHRVYGNAECDLRRHMSIFAAHLGGVLRRRSQFFL